MKRTDLLRSIRRQAKEAGVAFELKRQGRSHEVWAVGGLLITIPRHREINERTAKSILSDIENELTNE